MEDFIHLHVHTHFSILDGMSTVKKLVDKAVADGMRGMAITDHGVMYGVKSLADYCAKVNKQLKEEGKEPFKPIFGCEMYVARRGKEGREKEKGDLGGHHLVVLAKNKQGYKNLVKLVSRAWVDGFYGKPRTDRADLERYREGLMVCSACIAGEVPSRILKGDIAGARESIEWHKRVFGSDYYLEIQRHEVRNPAQRANRETYPLQQRANAVIEELAGEYGIKVVCTNDAHFVDEENAEAHDHLLCLATGKDFDDPNRMMYSKQEWFKTRAEMNEVFADRPQALANTMELLDKTETYSIDHEAIMPFFPIPADFGTEEQWRAKFTEEQLRQEFTTDENGLNPMDKEAGDKKIADLGGYDKIYRIKFEADYLHKLAMDGARRLYGDPVPQDAADQIKFEVHTMKTMGFPGYFLIVQDFIRAAREELSVMVGPGRGSAAGSVVAYCLGITKIDPMKYDLLFERFLNPDRVSLPDIDTDFDDDGRGRVLEWVENKYGKDNCAHIITYATMATKNSIKDVGRVEKLPLDVTNHLCKLIPDKLPSGKKMNLTNAIECIPELRRAEMSEDPKLHNTMEYAKMLEGTVRGTGIHACGIIICRDPISDWVPVGVAEDKSDPGHKLHCTQYDGHVIEQTGLIKMDFLGLKTLSELKEAVENVRLTTGKTIDLDNIPIDDPATYRLYQQGRTIGTFQFESPGMQKYLRELHPTVFEDLIAMNALYRPGPMQYIPDFIARKHNPSLIKYDIPCMEKYLSGTYGITVYQEQVMLLSRLLANFTRGQSDSLRKAMGKKQIEVMAKLEKIFYKGGQENGHSIDTLKKIWEDWKKFAEYAFNKSHSTCYSWVAFQTAYMKANYPAEYMAAIMSRRRDQITETAKLMDECKAMGISTLGPDVNESWLKFGVNAKGEIRFGLAAIKGMGDAAANAIIEERGKGGAFRDIFDFAERINLAAVNKKSFESLALSGALDSLGIGRERYFGTNAKGETFVETLVKYGASYQADKASAQVSLFGGDDTVEYTKPPIPEAEPWNIVEKLNREKELVGIYMSAHPLDDFAVILDTVCNTPCSELDDKDALAQKTEVKTGGIITGVKSKFTKNGKPFGIVKLEDYNGSGDFALFGEDWGRWRSSLMEGCSVLITGRCEQRYKDSPVKDFKVTNVEYMQTVKDRKIDSITINCQSSDIDTDMATWLADFYKENAGGTKLHLNISDPQLAGTVPLRSTLPGIEVNRKFIQFLKGRENISYHIN